MGGGRLTNTVLMKFSLKLILGRALKFKLHQSLFCFKVKESYTLTHWVFVTLGGKGDNSQASPAEAA